MGRLVEVVVFDFVGRVSVAGRARRRRRRRRRGGLFRQRRAHLAQVQGPAAAVPRGVVRRDLLPRGSVRERLLGHQVVEVLEGVYPASRREGSLVPRVQPLQPVKQRISSALQFRKRQLVRLGVPRGPLLRGLVRGRRLAVAERRFAADAAGNRTVNPGNRVFAEPAVQVPVRVPEAAAQRDDVVKGGVESLAVQLHDGRLVPRQRHGNRVELHRRHREARVGRIPNAPPLVPPGANPSVLPRGQHPTERERADVPDAAAAAAAARVAPAPIPRARRRRERPPVPRGDHLGEPRARAGSPTGAPREAQLLRLVDDETTPPRVSHPRTKTRGGVAGGAVGGIPFVRFPFVLFPFVRFPFVRFPFVPFARVDDGEPRDVVVPQRMLATGATNGFVVGGPTARRNGRRNAQTETSGTSSCEHTSTSHSFGSRTGLASYTLGSNELELSPSAIASDVSSPGTSDESARLHRRLGANSRRASSHCDATWFGHTTSVFPSNDSSPFPFPSPSSSYPSFLARAQCAAAMTVLPAPTGCATSPPRGNLGAASFPGEAPSCPSPPPSSSSAAVAVDVALMSASPMSAYGPRRGASFSERSDPSG